MLEALEAVCVEYDNVLVCGDFNLNSCTAEVHARYEYFLSFCDLRQVNTVRNKTERILDLVLVSLGLSDVSVQRELDWQKHSDGYHPPLAIELRLLTYSRSSERTQTDHPGDKQKIWNFKKANYIELYRSISGIKWGSLYSIKNPELAVNHFYEIINDCINRFVPTRSSIVKHSRYVYPEWYSPRTISHIRKKAHCHRRYKANNTPANRTHFMEWRARVKLNLKEDFLIYKERMEKDFKRDPSTFWGYVSSKRSKGKTSKKVLLDGKAITDEEAAKHFASYFYSVYSPQPPKLDIDEVIRATDSGSARIHISTILEEDVELAVRSLKPKRSVGPDGVPPYVVKDCGARLIEPMQYMFSLCFENAFYPDVWKLSRVVPVPKSSGSEVSDYRPVAVLSVFGKLFESILQSRISRQVESQLTDAQHGFRAGRSTATNLLSFWSYTLEAVDSGVQVDAAYFDFRKAFDTVDNDLLLQKFSRVGFTPHLLQFFSEYLRNRRQYVQYKGHTSEPYFTYSGVSQGSNLGPIEFLLMINDLPETVSTACCLLFADDLKLFMKIHDSSDSLLFQEDINRVFHWGERNKLFFNVKKCSVITFSKAKSPLTVQYSLGDFLIPRMNTVRDLGVLLSSDLTFSLHIYKMCSQAFRTLGFVMRQARHLDNISAIKALYNAFVRSKMESNAIIWNPHEDKYIDMVEKLQKKFLRWLYFKRYGYYVGYPFVYPSNFVRGMLDYSTLEARRGLSLMLCVWRILTGRMSVPSVLERLSLAAPASVVAVRQHRLFRVPWRRTEYGRLAPVPRALSMLNALLAQNRDLDLFHCTEAEMHRMIILFNIVTNLVTKPIQ